MKNIIIIILLLTCSVTYSQRITFGEVLALKNKDEIEIKEYLTRKGWEILHEHYTEKHKFGDIRFAFDNKNSDREIPLFIKYYHREKKIVNNIIEFEVCKKEIFEEYLTQFKLLNYILIETKVDINQTVETYKNETTTILIKILPVENYYGRKKTFYTFVIKDNNFKEKKIKF